MFKSEGGSELPVLNTSKMMLQAYIASVSSLDKTARQTRVHAHSPIDAQVQSSVNSSRGVVCDANDEYRRALYIAQTPLLFDEQFRRP